MVIEKMADTWRKVTTSRYARLLETTVDLQRAEIERLKADNRALYNSMMVRGGFTPLDDGEPAKSAPMPKRRSWQQLSRNLEIEAGREMIRKEKAKEGNNASV